LIWRGRFYEAWQRPSGIEAAVIGHLGLGSVLDPTGVPSCPEVQRLARRAGPGGTLAAASRAGVQTVPLDGTDHPPEWQWAGYPKTLLPVTPGTIRATVGVPSAGRYEVWLGGSVRPQVDLVIDGRKVGQVRHELNNEGEYVLLGAAGLSRGHHTLEIRFHGADLHPGSGGRPSPVGPLQLASNDAAETRITRVPAANASQLCGRRWDWIEALAPGAVGAG